MRELPLCNQCVEEITHDPVFEALCGHEECPSAVFHPLCLMRWREEREEAMELVRKFMDEHSWIFGEED